MSKKTLSKFHPNMSYKMWTNKLEMWQKVTTLPKSEQAILVLLEALDGNIKAEKAVENITVHDINNYNGINFLIEKLNYIFKSEKIDDAYVAYSKFIKFDKPEDLPMNEFLLESEHLYNKMKEHDMVLPNALTFKLLGSANLSEDDRKPALTLANDLKFESMKSALKRLFITPSSAPSPLVKKEEILFKSSKFNSRPDKNSTKQSNVNKLNPLDKN